MRFAISAVVTILALLALGLFYVTITGLSARSQPPAFEAQIARAVRRIAIPRDLRETPNPVRSTPDMVAEGMAHFADHCAVCHANDGSGNTEMNRGLYPRAPDMRSATTQQLTDGELFYIIENGVRFTGMPGWSTGTAPGEESTWHLVHFVRHLPQLSSDELEQMKELNPTSPDEVRAHIKEEEFLKGAN